MPRDDLSGWGSDGAELPIERRLDRLGWRIDSLDRWRRDVDHRLRAAEDEIDAVTKAQEIAEAVADELAKASAPAEHVAHATADEIESRGGTRLALTWYQKLGGAVMGAIVVIDAIRGLVS